VGACDISYTGPDGATKITHGIGIGVIRTVHGSDEQEGAPVLESGGGGSGIEPIANDSHILNNAREHDLAVSFGHYDHSISCLSQAQFMFHFPADLGR